MDFFKSTTWLFRLQSIFQMAAYKKSSDKAASNKIVPSKAQIFNAYLTLVIILLIFLGFGIMAALTYVPAEKMNPLDGTTFTSVVTIIPAVMGIISMFLIVIKGISGRFMEIQFYNTLITVDLNLEKHMSLQRVYSKFKTISLLALATVIALVIIQASPLFTTSSKEDYFFSFLCWIFNLCRSSSPK